MSARSDAHAPTCAFEQPPRTRYAGKDAWGRHQIQFLDRPTLAELGQIVCTCDVARGMTLRDWYERHEGPASATVLEDRIRCSRCGKSVSTPVPTETIIRAWIECPECIEAQADERDR